MYAALSVLLPAAWVFLLWWCYGTFRANFEKSDGRHYMELAHQGRTIRPFHYRWLQPWFERLLPGSWQAVSYTALILTGPLFYAYLRTLDFSPSQSLLGVALFCGSFGIFAYPAYVIHFVEPLANFYALLSALCWLRGQPMLALLFSLLAGCTKETAPLGAALFAASPWPLLGLLAPAARILLSRPAPPDNEEHIVRLRTASPIRGTRRYRMDRKHWFLDPKHLVFPWGVGLLALLSPTPWLLITLLVAYGTLLAASDTERLYMSLAFPVVYLHAIPWIPAPALLAAAVAQMSWGILSRRVP